MSAANDISACFICNKATINHDQIQHFIFPNFAVALISFDICGPTKPLRAIQNLCVVSFITVSAWIALIVLHLLPHRSVRNNSRSNCANFPPHGQEPCGVFL